MQERFRSLKPGVQISFKLYLKFRKVEYKERFQLEFYYVFLTEMVLGFLVILKKLESFQYNSGVIGIF
jgi:hypothetical protein